MKTEILKTKRIAVLLGGLSSEREVSLNTGRGVFEGLRGRGYDVVAIDWSPGTSLPELLVQHDVDIVWNALHGTYGEDGAVQGLLACMHIPCTGAGILASALAMDKIAAKRHFDSIGIPTPRWAVVGDGDDLSDWDVPLVVKPARDGSSVGVSVVFDRAEIPAALARARALEEPVLVEEYIAGAELCTAILDGEVLGSCEIRPASGFYDYDAKYRRSDTQYLVPPPLPPAVLATAEALARAAHEALDCGAYSRVDLRLRDTGEPFVLEVNTLPGMTGTSLIPKIAAHAGLDYASLCERILASAR